VSDGPDRETKQTVEKWTQEVLPPIRYCALPRKQGPAAARNAGWRHAKADFIAFTDDDCLPDPFWLSRLWQTYSSQQQPLIAYSGRVIVPISNTPTDHELNTTGLETSEFVTANCACTKQALERVGGFDEQFRMAWREDSDLYFKLIQSRIAVYRIEEAIVIHPVREAPWGISLKEQKKGVYNALLYKKYPQLYKEKIHPRSAGLYYIIVLSFVVFLAGVILASPPITLTAFVSWSLFTGWFILKRLSATSRSFRHVMEMVVTSILIPFLSVYWRLYGSWKYKTLLI
jgi:glycosyltransferase involved in cell wall biosynthesis